MEGDSREACTTALWSCASGVRCELPPGGSGLFLINCVPRALNRVRAEVVKQLCEGECRSPFREVIKGSRHSSKQSLKSDRQVPEKSVNTFQRA